MTKTDENGVWVDGVMKRMDEKGQWVTPVKELERLTDYHIRVACHPIEEFEAARHLIRLREPGEPRWHIEPGTEPMVEVRVRSGRHPQDHMVELTLDTGSEEVGIWEDEKTLLDTLLMGASCGDFTDMFEPRGCDAEGWTTLVAYYAPITPRQAVYWALQAAVILEQTLVEHAYGQWAIRQPDKETQRRGHRALWRPDQAPQG